MAEPNDDETFLVCWPVAELTRPSVPGSTVDLCCRCETRVTVSPASRAQAGPTAKIICADCAMKEIDPEKAQFHMPSAEVLQEIEDHIPQVYVVGCGLCGALSQDNFPALEAAEEWMLAHTADEHPDELEHVRAAIRKGPELPFAPPEERE